MAGVILSSSTLEVDWVLGVGVGHLVPLHPHTGQPVIVRGLGGLLRVPAKTPGSANPLEKLVDMDQYYMDTGGHTELKALLLGEISDSLVTVLKVLDGSKIVWVDTHPEASGFHYVEGLETRGVTLELIGQVLLQLSCLLQNVTALIALK